MTNYVNLIKKYKNGKYYCVGKGYLNQDKVFDMFLSGEIKIVNSSGEDITGSEVLKCSNGMKVNVHDIKELFR